jgi:hypothetical protein
VSPRDIAIAQARGRIALGAGALLAPGIAGRAWIGRDANRAAVKVLARGLGARDVALGLGVVIALDRGAPVRGWLEGSALADAGDFLATLVAGSALPPAARGGVLAIAAASAGVATWLSRAVDSPAQAFAGQTPESALTMHPA